MAPNVREDFSLQPELAYSLAVLARLFRRSGRSEFDVFNTEGVQRFRDGNFGFGIEESVRKLLSLCSNKRRVRTNVDVSDSAGGATDL